MKGLVKKSCLNHEACSSLAECGPILHTFGPWPCLSLTGTAAQKGVGDVSTQVRGTGTPKGLVSPLPLGIWQQQRSRHFLGFSLKSSN